MKTSKNIRVGVFLLVGAALAAIAVHFLGGGLITTKSLPIPPPLPGRLSPSSVSETVYHWPLLVLALVAIAGLVCLFVPRRGEHIA